MALLATGTVHNDGLISADGLGFRGGAWGAAGVCVPAPSLAVAAGEGIWGQGRTFPDARDTGTGGGGSPCGSGGRCGAGGAGYGRGGGVNNNSTWGGLALGLLGSGRLPFGGGGGTSGEGMMPGNGGRGGGGVFIRSRSVRGAGLLSASGFVATGFSGGGGGGVVDVRAVEALECAKAAASGGRGSAVGGFCGGGGGGGGWTRLQGASVSCSAEVLAGSAGHGAFPQSADDPDYRGSVTIIETPFDPSGGVSPSLGPDAGCTSPPPREALRVGCGCAKTTLGVQLTGLLGAAVLLHWRLRQRRLPPGPYSSKKSAAAAAPHQPKS